jgi:6-phosphogluconolactonase
MTQTVVYVSCAESREIQVFLLAADSGELRLRQSLATDGVPQPLRLSPDRRVLYAGLGFENALLALAVDPESGGLSVLGRVAAPEKPTYVSCDGAMRMAFSASYGGNTLSVFPLNAQGAPLPVSQHEINLPHAHAALADTSGRWLLVPLLAADAIRVYRLNDDASIAASEPLIAKARAGSGPRHFVFSPDEARVYCLNELDGTIDRFDFDAASGTLTMRQSISILPPGFSGKPWAAELRTTPDGRFLYASERTASVIAAFSADLETGALQPIDHYPTETQPRGMGIAPSGRWLVAAGQLSNQLTVYALDPTTGRLAARQRCATGGDPICVEIAALPIAKAKGLKGSA